MSLINENFLKLQDSYLFSTIAKKVAKFTEENPEKEIIKLGIGDVTRPIVPACIEAMHKAVDEIGTKEGFKGYGPEQGYDFLRDAIVKNDYKSRGIDVKKDEIFVSDGAKCDCGNIVDIFGKENKVAITDPVYPVYLDTNIMSGRDVIYLPVTAKNNFMPELPKEKVDMIYLCFPNNPTGTVLTKEELKIGASNSVVVDSNGGVIANLSGDEKRKVIKLEDMADYLPKAYVAIEDERFYKHNGVDLKRTAGAILHTVTGNSSYGGSTCLLYTSPSPRDS